MTHVAWSCDGKKLAAVGIDRIVRVWQPEKSMEMRSATLFSGGHLDDVDYVAWNPTHPELFCSSSQKDRRIVFWDARQSRHIQMVSLRVPPAQMNYSPDGKTLLYISVGNQLHFMEYKKDTSKEGEEAKEQWTTVDREPNTASTAMFNHAGDGIILTHNSEHTIRVLDYPSLQLYENPAAHVGGCVAVALDPRGRYLASGGHDSIVNLFDLSEWICARTITACEHAITALSFSHDGEFIAIANQGPYIDICATETSEPMHRVPALAPSPTVTWHPSNSVDISSFDASSKALRPNASNAPTLTSRIATRMFPLIPALALAFVSFLCSAFVILRIILPILPPHPLSRRVPPSEFGLPNFRSISASDKSHVWLAFCDLLALTIFVWEAVEQYLGSASGFQTASDPASATRLWFALTLRQTCLLVVSGITLLHVRMGRSVSFGAKHWILWAPMLVFVVTSTALAGVLAGTTMSSFFVGYVAYSAVTAVASTVFFGCLVGSLIIIKRNLTVTNDDAHPWPPVREVEEKPRPSFATEDIDVLRDGSSWITSRAGSSHDSVSAFSFSTHQGHSQHPAVASNPSIPAKSSFWFNPATPHGGATHDSVPPVPPLPSPYRHALNEDPDPFRRSESPHEARIRMGSQSSWLTSSSGTRPTMTAWSFPTDRMETPMAPALASTNDLNSALLQSRPVTPGMASAQVLGGYGYAPSSVHLEQGVGALAAVPASDIDVSWTRALGWLASVWVPLVLSLPYCFSVLASHSQASQVMSILLTVSVTISSPIMAVNILLRSPIPIPTGLFDVYNEPPSAVARSPSPAETLPVGGEYKRSASVTLIEGRRSTDVWLAKGDAIDGKTRVGRALEMLAPAPKLSVLPPEETEDVAPLTPPLPIQDDTEPTIPPTPQSANSAELGHNRTRTRKESKASSHFSGGDDSLAVHTRIMIAQRHYSAVATAMFLPGSPTNAEGQFASTQPTHLRTRSASSFSGPQSPISQPPSSPLPPTPPSVRNARLLHRRSRSSGFDFGAIAHGDVNEIDALSAKLLPLLVPGLKVGADMPIREDWSPPGTWSKASTKAGKAKGRMSVLKEAEAEFGGFTTSAEFSSPEFHSTPVNRKGARARKASEHKRHHFSLPSLSLGKDGVLAMSTWRNQVNHGPESVAMTVTDVGDRRKTYNGVESTDIESAELKPVNHGQTLQPVAPGAQLTRSASGRTIGPRPSSSKLADLPTGVDTARSSLTTLIAALDQPMARPLPSATSEVTLFDFDSEAPLAESTPPDYRRHSGVSSRSGRSGRRSSIVYIKSDNNTDAPTGQTLPRLDETNENTNPSIKTSPPGRLQQWGTRAVRPLMPKSSKSHKKPVAPADTPTA
ncbi:hypothetical protein EWM64_g1313, partial [Hericium alpestre]